MNELISIDLNVLSYHLILLQRQRDSYFHANLVVINLLFCQLQLLPYPLNSLLRLARWTPISRDLLKGRVDLGIIYELNQAALGNNNLMQVRHTTRLLSLIHI